MPKVTAAETPAQHCAPALRHQLRNSGQSFDAGWHRHVNVWLLSGRGRACHAILEVLLAFESCRYCAANVTGVRRLPWSAFDCDKAVRAVGCPGGCSFGSWY